MRERGRDRVRAGERQQQARWATLSYGHVRSRGRSQQRRSTPRDQRRRQNAPMQGQKGHIGETYDKGVFKQATPYFFTNFPD